MQELQSYGVSLSSWDRKKFSSFEEAVEARRKELVEQEKERLMREDPSLSDEEALEKAEGFVSDRECFAILHNVPYDMVSDDMMNVESIRIKVRREFLRKNRGKRM